MTNDISQGMLARDGDAFHQVGSEHERTVQHAQEEWVLACQVTVDFVGHAAHFFQYILLFDGDGEFLVFDLYAIHGTCEY